MPIDDKKTSMAFGQVLAEMINKTILV